MPQQIDKIRAALGAVKRCLRPTAEWVGLELVWDRQVTLPRRGTVVPVSLSTTALAEANNTLIGFSGAEGSCCCRKDFDKSWRDSEALGCSRTRIHPLCLHQLPDPTAQLPGRGLENHLCKCGSRDGEACHIPGDKGGQGERETVLREPLFFPYDKG